MQRVAAFNLALSFLKGIEEGKNVRMTSAQVKSLLKEKLGQDVAYKWIDNMLDEYSHLFKNMGCNSTSKWGNITTHNKQVFKSHLIMMAENYILGVKDEVLSLDGKSYKVMSWGSRGSSIYFKNVKGIVKKTNKEATYIAVIPTYTSHNIHLLLQFDKFPLQSNQKVDFTVRLCLNAQKELVAEIFKVNEALSVPFLKEVAVPCSVNSYKKKLESVQIVQTKGKASKKRSSSINSDLSSRLSTLDLSNEVYQSDLSISDQHQPGGSNFTKVVPLPKLQPFPNQELSGIEDDDGTLESISTSDLSEDDMNMRNNDAFVLVQDFIDKTDKAKKSKIEDKNKKKFKDEKDCFDASEYTSKSIMNAESSNPLQLEQGWKTSNGGNLQILNTTFQVCDWKETSAAELSDCKEVEVTLRGKFKIGLGQQILGINNMETQIITVKQEK